jgi:DNA-binding MarR family transcriptional regulator
VRRRRCPKDRRQVLCWITDAGLKLLAGLDKPVSETAPRFLKSLSDSELKSLIDMLARIRSEIA